MLPQTTFFKLGQQIGEALLKLPPCPKDQIRLYRATIDTMDSIRERHTKLEKRWQKEGLELEELSDEETKDFKRIIARKHSHFGRFYSDSLASTLPYFQRHHDDKDSDRVLSYVDVPIEQARRYYLENATNMQGLPKKAQSHRFWSDFAQAYATAIIGEEKEEFYLPDKLVKNKKNIVRIPANTIFSVLQEDLRKVGEKLDETFTMPHHKRGEVNIISPGSLTRDIRSKRSAPGASTTPPGKGL